MKGCADREVYKNMIALHVQTSTNDSRRKMELKLCDSFEEANYETA